MANTEVCSTLPAIEENGSIGSTIPLENGYIGSVRFTHRGSKEANPEEKRKKVCAASVLIQEANATGQLRENTIECTKCPFSVNLTINRARIPP